MPFHAADKNVVGGWLVSRLLVVRAIRRAFSSVYIYVDGEARRLRGTPPLPVIFCATHSGWWDGYMSFLVNEKVFRHDGYLMMEEINLERYPFLTWGGVFGVDRDDPRKALASIEYIATLLQQRPGASLWMFPQGTITHPDRRPLKLYGGVANIARRVGRCAIVPVAMRYEFLLDQSPEAFIRVGPPVFVGEERLSSREINALIEQSLTSNADRLRDDVVAGRLSDYRRIMGGRGSVNRVWDGVLKVVERLRQPLKR